MQIGIDEVGAKLLARGRCAIVSLPNEGLCARVADHSYQVESLETELRMARILSAAGLPCLRPAKLACAPDVIVTSAGALTLWPLGRSPRDGEFTWKWLGCALRQLHDHQLPKDFPSLWNPIGMLRQRIASYCAGSWADASHVAILLSELDWASEALSALSTTMKMGVIHGDAHPNNVVIVDGTPLLIDYELTGVGPCGWDIVTPRVLQRHWPMHAEAMSQFLDGYGFDWPDSPSLRRLLRIRELLDISHAVSLVGKHPDAPAELAARLKGWCSGAEEDRTSWRFFRMID